MSFLTGIEIISVAALYREYAKLAVSYSPGDNPLHALSHAIPASAHYYCVVSPDDAPEAERLMKRIAGRRKLRRLDTTRVSMNITGFSPYREIVIFYA